MRGALRIIVVAAVAIAAGMTVRSAAYADPAANRLMLTGTQHVHAGGRTVTLRRTVRLDCGDRPTVTGTGQVSADDLCAAVRRLENTDSPDHSCVLPHTTTSVVIAGRLAGRPLRDAVEDARACGRHGVETAILLLDVAALP
jgi:hypothetical protein